MEHVGSKCPPYFAKSVLRKYNPHRLRAGIDTHHAVLRRGGIYAHAFRLPLGDENTVSRRVDTRCPRSLPLSGRQGTRGQQVPTLLCYFAKSVLRKQNPHRCLRTGIDHTMPFSVGWAFMPTRFRLPSGEGNTNSRKVGTRCPRGLPAFGQTGNAWATSAHPTKPALRVPSTHPTPPHIFRLPPMFGAA